ncbi:hypothetical protein BGX31_009200 [Mortierella sp. GBA43]|nr:hypothetical protein BGX31_009200 [Mortierella sp. GBA43]
MADADRLKPGKPLWHKVQDSQRVFFYNPIPQAQNRSKHFEFTGQLLRRSLVRRDYFRAFRIYSCLVSCTPVAEEFVWKRQTILLETALYQLRFGRLKDAHETLEPYAEVHPFTNNALLQGYAGVIEYALWIRKIREKRGRQSDGQSDKSNQERCSADINQDPTGIIGDGRSDDDDDDDDWLEEGDERRHDSKINRYKNAAEKFLERALELDKQNDMFLTYLVRSKCGRVDFSGLGSRTISRARKIAIFEMQNYLKRFWNCNNNSLLALSRLLAALENRENQQTLQLILTLDPVANSELYVQPLLKMLIQGLPANVQSTIADSLEEAGTRRPTTPLSSQSRRTLLHEVDVKCLDPLLRILLTRAEYGVLTGNEKQLVNKICSMVCCCSDCLKHQQGVSPHQRSYFDTLPPRMQPSWYSKLAIILYRGE